MLFSTEYLIGKVKKVGFFAKTPVKKKFDGHLEHPQTCKNLMQKPDCLRNFFDLYKNFY